MTFLLLIIAGFVFLTSCNNTSEDVYFSVVFVDENDNVLKTEKVLKNKSAIAPNPPIIEGYKFKEWNKDFSNVNKDLTVKAIYFKESINSYNVIFFDNENEILNRQTIEKGKGATAPNPPSITGYIFIGWDQDFSEVVSDLEVRPLYDIKKYNVSFISEGEIVFADLVNHGSDLIPPNIERLGYEFIEWDKSYLNIKSDLVVKAIWKRLIQASYVANFDFIEPHNYLELLTDIETAQNLKSTISDVKNGGFRNTNELVYYNNPATHNTNIYGFEVAVNSNNIVIEKATKVEMPLEGFVLSAHGTSINRLEPKVNLGDYIVYNNNQIKIYRNKEINDVIGIGIELERLKTDIFLKNEAMYALDYQLIQTLYNDGATIYNNLTTDYSSSLLEEVKELLLRIDFLLIEPTASTVRAMWHYPLRSPGYSENNTFEVKRYLDKVKTLGINRIYLNTNFNGSSIYKSEYLRTLLTQHNKYEGYKDYLECFIEEAHQRGIEVFAWTNTLIAGDGSNNSFYSSRGWLTKGYNGEDNSGRIYYLDISNTEAMEFLKNVFTELTANYNLDGIEYDFIRFPSGNAYNYKSGDDTANLRDWGYTESFITSFMNKYNLSGDLKDLVKNDANIRNNWLLFKEETLSDVVEMLTTTIKEANPNIKIAAAVMPSITSAKNAYLQDW